MLTNSQSGWTSSHVKPDSFFFVPCPLSNNTTAHSSQEVEGGLGSERAGFTGNAKLCLWARWSKQHQGRACSKANVDPTADTTSRGQWHRPSWAHAAVIAQDIQERAFCVCLLPRFTPLISSLSCLHLRKKLLWTREPSEQLWKMVTLLRCVLFVVCLASRLLLSSHHLRWSVPQDGVRRVHGRGGSSLATQLLPKHSCWV